MYINGDILISPFILSYFIKNNYKFKHKRVYITADRHNIYINNSSFIKLNNHREVYKKARQYTLCGQDIFITTKNTFNKEQIFILKNIAIGRYGIDNILLGMAIKDKNIITVDISDVVQAIHIQYSLKNKYSKSIKKKDYNWNYNIVKVLNKKIIGYSCLNKIMCRYNISTSTYDGNFKCILLN